MDSGISYKAGGPLLKARVEIILPLATFETY